MVHNQQAARSLASNYPPRQDPCFASSMGFTQEEPSPQLALVPLEVIILSVEPGKIYPLTLFITGKETSLKQIISHNPDYWHTAYPGRSQQDMHALTVYRKGMEPIQGYNGLQLHALFLKNEGYKCSRNPNALPIEQFCGTQFYGPLVVAMNITSSPYSLCGFRLLELQILYNVNKLYGRNKPGPMKNKAAKKVEEIMESKRLEPLMSASGMDKFYMFRYKTQYCPLLSTKHDTNLCIYAHSAADYRRPPEKFQYSPAMCPSQKGHGVCSKKEACGFCHSAYEKLYHPSRYKVSPCEQLVKNRCKKGDICPYYHAEADKRNPDTLEVQPRDTLHALSSVVPNVSYVDVDYNYFAKIGTTVQTTPSLPKPAPPSNPDPFDEQKKEESKVALTYDEKERRVFSRVPSNPDEDMETLSEIGGDIKTDDSCIPSRNIVLAAKTEEQHHSFDRSSSCKSRSNKVVDVFELFSQKADPASISASTSLSNVEPPAGHNLVIMDRYIDSNDIKDSIDENFCDSKLNQICESILASGGSDKRKRGRLILPQKKLN